MNRDFRPAIRRALNQPCNYDFLRMHSKTPVGSPKGGKKVTHFPNIVADALALGVSRQHLYQVLRGTRKSRRLMRQYQVLKKEAA